MSAPERRGGLNAALLRLPLPIYFVILLLAWMLSRFVLHSGAVTVVDLVVDGVGGVIFAAVLTALLAFRRRRLGGATRFADYASAVRTGTVPAGSDTSTWRPMLERDARSLRVTQWAAPAVMLLFAGLGIVLIVLATTSGDRLLGALFAVLFVAFAAVVLVQGRRRSAHIRSLLDRIRVAPGAATATGGREGDPA